MHEFFLKYLAKNNFKVNEKINMEKIPEAKKGASPQGSIHHQMVSESWNFTDRVQMGALREKYF